MSNVTGAASPASTPRRLAGALLLVALVAAALLRSHAGTRLDGFTVDEPWHVVAGVSYLRTGDFRLNPEHPPLVKLVAGAGQAQDFALRPLAPLAEKTQERELVEETMFYDNDAAVSQRATRLSLWTFHGALLLALGGLLWRLAGLPWAAGTLGFLAIEPAVGAHLPVAMTDLPLALTLAVAVACAGGLMAGWRWAWVAATGLALGLVLASKHSALAGLAGLGAVLGIAALLGARAGGREVAARVGKLAVAGLLALAVLWATYGFRFHAGPDGSDGFNRAMPDKIADLAIPHWRNGIALADDYRILPRAYLWGLADTVRAGIEGRGQPSHFVLGVSHKGRPPWFTWPSVVAGKVPLALLVMTLLAVVLLPRTPLPAPARGMLLAAAGVFAAHLAALMSGQGTYGGIRHALPLVLLMAMLAGGLLAWAWSRPRRGWRAVALLPLALALLMTAREPRLWEYHNEWAGGTAGAYRLFGNEGIDLGQRWPEIRAFHDARIVPEKADLFSDYWFMEEQAIAAGTRYRRKVDSLDDANIAGVYEGYFLYGIHMTLPWPEWGWDPAVNLAGLDQVARIGNVVVYKGRREDPQGRAVDVYEKVLEHLYQEGGGRDEVVVMRLQEVVAQLPQMVGAAVELGNAQLRLGRREEAIAAYRGLLEQQLLPLEPLVRAQVEAQVAALESGTALSGLRPLRNPQME